MSNTVVINHIGAAGRPFLFSVAEQVVVHQAVLPNHKQDTIGNLLKMASSSRPTVKLNGLAPVSEDSTVTAPVPDRDALKLRMLQRLRPPPFKYAWCLYHDKHSASADYEGRLTLLLENIVTIKPFWESFNQLPLTALRMKDSVHFFKRGVKPVWEDPRNISGGSWTFRVPKAQSEEFWKEALLIAVGEQFADVIQPRDDLCGLSLSVRFNSNLITIWNRDGSNQKTIDGILAVMMQQLSPALRPKEGSYYYKKHSEHAGFHDVVAKAKEANEAKDDNGKIMEAEVQEKEGNAALLKEAEGVDLADLEKV